MSLTFYPHDDDMNIAPIKDRLEIMLEAAERYKAAVLDPTMKLIVEEFDDDNKPKGLTPKNIRIAFNWQEAAKLIREVREMPENNPTNKAAKADRLERLAELYEVLRSAKLPKLEVVRMVLLNESKQLRSGTASAPP